MRSKVLLLLCLLFGSVAMAQPPGWSYAQPITVTNPGSVAVLNYQIPLIINTQALISSNQMLANGNDLRFGADCGGTTLYPYYIDTGLNTTATRIWVKIDQINANASKVIYMYYGNNTAAAGSSLTTFNGPFSSTNQVSGGTSGGVTLSQRGFRFSPNTDILVTQFGKNEPNGTVRYVTLFDFTSQAILRQMQVAGPASVYTYSNLSSPIWLTTGTNYILQLFQGAADGYFYQTSSQINANLTYYDMRYCNSCTQTTFPTTVLTNLHYGYPDFNFYTRNIVTPAPTYVIGGSGGGGGGVSVQPRDTIVCANTPAQFKATLQGAPTGLQWQEKIGTTWSNLTNSAQYSGVATNILTIASAGPTMNGYYYRLVFTGPCGPSKTDSAKLTAVTSITPTASISSPNTSICGTGTASFTSVTTNGGTAPTYQWLQNGNPLLGATNPTYSGSFLNNGDIITLSYHSSISCANPATVISNGLTMGVLPPTGATSVILCQFENASALTAAGTALKWYTTATGGTPLTTAPVPPTFVPGTLTYYVSQTIGSCESPRLAIVVTVRPKPAPPTIVTPVVYCQYDNPMQLTATGLNLKWYTGPLGGQGSTLAPTPNSQYEDTTSWWVTQTVNGCESDRSKIDVEVYQQPNGIIIYVDKNRKFVCQYDTCSFWYFGNARPDATIDWKVPAGKALIKNIDVNQTRIFVRFDSAGTIPIRMQVDNHGCASKEFILNVPVRPVPIVRIATQPAVCIGDTSLITVDYSTPGISNFAWNFGAGTEIFGNTGGSGPYGVLWPAAGNYVISVKATANECTSPDYTYNVLVRPLPDARIGFVSAKKICTGDTVQLMARQKQDSTYSYVWTPGLFFNNGEGAGTFSDVVTATVTRREMIYLEVFSEFGCHSKDSVLIDAQPCCELYLPTAFTPNNDGRNDVFRIIGPGHHSISMFRIQDRWGKTVFETADENIGWDGNMGGRAQDGGTYFYYIKYQCTDKKFYEQKGELTLIR